MKKIIYGLIVIMIVTAMSVTLLGGCTVGRTLTSGDFQYSISSNREVGITKYIGKGGHVTIPSNFGPPVVSIDGAFANCTHVTAVDISSSVRFINENAFYGCTGLTSMIFPISIKTVWDNAFAGCSSLHAVYFEGDAPALGKNVFSGTPSDFTIYYHADKSGWSNPWNGYRTATY